MSNIRRGAKALAAIFDLHCPAAIAEAEEVTSAKDQHAPTCPYRDGGGCDCRMRLPLAALDAVRAAREGQQ